MTPLDRLTPKRRAFVVAYVTGDTAGDGAASYRAAGYKGKGARASAHRLLTNADILAAIAWLRQTTIARAEQGQILTSVERLRILARIARDTAAPPAARIAAIKLDAQLQGELVRKTETTTRTDNPAQRRSMNLARARERAREKGFKIVG